MRTRVKWLFAGIIATALAALVLVNVNVMPSESRISQKVERLYATGDAQYRREMSVLLGPPLVPGNRVEALVNGDRIFPSMLEAIRSAKRTITFETYIYWSGETGAAFAQALSERSRSGVRVHVLLDWVGSQKIDKDLLAAMRDAGVDIRFFHPLSWYNLARLNNRTHRKILVVDGRIGFTGGVGIADKWEGDAQDADHWRDTHFRVEGPVVAQMQAAFCDNWTKVTGVVLHGEDYFPAIEPVGDSVAQMFESSPQGGAESMHLMYLLAVTSAARSIELSNSYFVPDDLAVDALVAALKRGVRVRIIVPGPINDTETVQKASRASWGALLSAGAEIYEFQPTMFHCKVLVVDGLMVSVGSTNFDNRSFRLNDEANLNVVDGAFARQQIAIFEQDLAKSKRVSYEAWAARPWTEKAAEYALSAFDAQL